MTGIATLTSGELKRVVLRAPGPAALDFYQASCPPRRVLEPRLARVARQYAGRVPVYAWTSTPPGGAGRFGVQSLPTALVFRDGAGGERLDGFITEVQPQAAFAPAVRA